MKNHVNTFLLFFSVLFIQAQKNSPIIPLPQEVITKTGHFSLDKHTGIIATSQELREVASYLQFETLNYKELPLAIEDDANNRENTILLQLTDEETPKGAYQLSITPNGIKVKSGNLTGVFYGVVSLLQLIVNEEIDSQNNIKIPSMEITDSPHYKWRGLMLDTSRYFVSKQKIISLIDWMAFYKLNKLHLHLTDEPAWRVEIKKYPKLALVGGIGNENNPLAPAKFYTQQELKEIVEYAEKRKIEVIPEIDMPGHATAANRAYPEYSGGGSEEYPEFTFDPGKDETYGYLTDILREVNTIFPSNMLHLGGDEVSFGNEKWKDNEGIKTLIDTHGLESLKEVEHYFIKRMADSIYNFNSKLIAWDELAGVDLPKDKTIIFWWRHDLPEQFNLALEKGYKTVVTPRIPYYFDFVQHESHNSGRRMDGEFSTLKKLYSFSIEDWIDKENIDNKNNVLGVQASLWGETISSDTRLEFLLFPRIAALAESAWREDEDRKNFQGFKLRLKKHLDVYKSQDIYYFNPFNPQEFPEVKY